MGMRAILSIVTPMLDMLCAFQVLWRERNRRKKKDSWWVQHMLCYQEDRPHGTLFLHFHIYLARMRWIHSCARHCAKHWKCSLNRMEKVPALNGMVVVSGWFLKCKQDESAAPFWKSFPRDFLNLTLHMFLILEGDLRRGAGSLCCLGDHLSSDTSG